MSKWRAGNNCESDMGKSKSQMPIVHLTPVLLVVFLIKCSPPFVKQFSSQLLKKSSDCRQIEAKSCKILCFPPASWRGFWLIALYRGCCIMGISLRTLLVYTLLCSASYFNRIFHIQLFTENNRWFFGLKNIFLKCMTHKVWTYILAAPTFLPSNFILKFLLLNFPPKICVLKCWANRF